MAEAFLQFILDKLSSLIQKELGSFWGVDKEVKKLFSTLSTIQAVLADAEEKQFREKAIKDWLRKLKDAAYDADDILDEFATEASWLEHESRIFGGINKVHTCFMRFSSPKNILFRRKIANKVKDIVERLDLIAEERMKFHMEDTRVAEAHGKVMKWRQTGSFLTESVVYGREEDREKIVENLLKVSSASSGVSVYPIVGIGGLGKTTLAQLVFNDERIRRHFALTIWVCISEDFDMKRVIKSIIESATGNACETLDLDPLQRRIQEIMSGRRYLIVLDDVWNEDQQKWNALKTLLACGSKGASVIVTTRLNTVASIVGTFPAHCLSNLTEDDCWSLFRERAFGLQTEREHANLVAIGKEIVKKCGGVPLAAQALGSLLRFEDEEKQWLHVRDSELWNLRQDVQKDENSIWASLRLSYFNLPLNLRQCFAYCAIFPKDDRIGKEFLIHLWMANGLITSHGQLEVEEVGNDICNKLYWRSLFQDAEKDEVGNIQSFRMHDLVHDLAQSVMDDECKILEPGKSMSSSRRIRHATIPCYSKESFTNLDVVHEVESSRTLLMPWYNDFVFFCDFSKFHSLHVLVVTDSTLIELPSSIGNLKHLRYLDLSNSIKIKTLPESICNLRNLQTLKLEGCYEVQRLPVHIRLLKNLRHLCIKGCWSLSCLPPKIGQLTCLRTLSLFIVGRNKGCHLAELQTLDLKGELFIRHLERVENPKDAKEANLFHKENLHCLSLDWTNNGKPGVPSLAEQVLKSLEPHPNLKQLRIYGYMGLCFPNWISEPVFDNLLSIELFNCKNCVDFPHLGKLCSLRDLSLYEMNDVEYLDKESQCEGAMRGFPSLKTLSIIDLPRLERLSRDEGRQLLPQLSMLTIHLCPNMSSLPSLVSLKELEIQSCNELLFKSIPNLCNLTSLSIGINNEVITFPDGMFQNLTALGKLRIENLTKLEVLAEDLFIGLNSLKELYIGGCNELESLPEQGLRDLISLQSLEIDKCRKFRSLSEGIRQLSSLRVLTISGCPDLAALPDAIGHLVSLQLLHIICCPNLASLPNSLGKLTSLQTLYIWDCITLTSLPTSIQNLTNLQELWIEDCPDLVT